MSQADLRGKVAACCSMPRLAFTTNMFCAVRAAQALGIKMIRRTGAYWGQSLQLLLEQLSAEVPYVLTLDYDSVFHPMDVHRLYRLMEENPEADAICGVQMGRERDTIMVVVGDENGTPRDKLWGEDVAKEIMPILSGHFGLTILRSETLAKMPKPWFLGIPDEQGSWNDGKIDDDIYFWQKLRECGLRAYQANRIPIGHAQLVITWPSLDLAPLHQFMSDYDKIGKPEGIWK